ncbi:IclR family transcriptional regulator [uncultured Paracoccus sp.]|uniref:IclR family transcriptional regulator n=1 Tax=uncultured Paracoccus sp. TaxID=189685 RepID=UPI0026247171|nr:IclR family transcriptional regulator [uncultured Paracoccus sp.]
MTSDESSEATRYRAPALDKGLDILELLAASSMGLTQAEIAKGLGRGANEIYRMLDTLVRRGYVTRTLDGDRYTLSLRLLVLADIHPPRRRLLDAAEPRMRAFSARAEQSIHLAVMEASEVIISASFSAPGNWRMSLRVGSVIGLFNTGSGMVLAAFQRPDIRARIFRDHRLVPGESALSEADYDARTAAIRAAGNMSGESQTTVGVLNLSCPILDPFGNAIAALTCPYLRRIDSYATPGRDQTLALLREAADEIAREVMGPPHEPAQS